jgi:hypothetical protein
MRLKRHLGGMPHLDMTTSKWDIFDFRWRSESDLSVGPLADAGGASVALTGDSASLFTIVGRGRPAFGHSLR